MRILLTMVSRSGDDTSGTCMCISTHSHTAPRPVNHGQPHTETDRKGPIWKLAARLELGLELGLVNRRVHLPEWQKNHPVSSGGMHLPWSPKSEPQGWGDVCVCVCLCITNSLEVLTDCFAIPRLGSLGSSTAPTRLCCPCS